MNYDLNHVNSKIVQWHHDRNLIEGATDWSQTEKMFEEFIELVAAQMPDETPSTIVRSVEKMLFKLFENGKIKTVKAEDAHDAKIDAIGDMDVVGVNILERNGISKAVCLWDVFEIINKRTGKTVDGTFVKDGD